jgi:hypothetical protein
MKNLLLNSLFFVVPALILMECARMFPTDAKPANYKSSLQQTIPIIAPAKQNLSPITIVPIAPVFKNAATGLFLKPSPLPLDLMIKTKGHKLLKKFYGNLNNWGKDSLYNHIP